MFPGFNEGAGETCRRLLFFRQNDRRIHPSHASHREIRPDIGCPLTEEGIEGQGPVPGLLTGQDQLGSA